MPSTVTLPNRSMTSPGRLLFLPRGKGRGGEREGSSSMRGQFTGNYSSLAYMKVEGKRYFLIPDPLLSALERPQ